MIAFLQAACEVDPVNRASADELLQNDFVRSAESKAAFSALLKTTKKV
jgi:hypothetical protein